MMDDVLVFGKDKEEHSRRLEMVLRKLSESKVMPNQGKCEFTQPEVKFLEQIIDQNGVHPDPLKVKAITDMPPPTNRTEVRRSLGMKNQLANFAHSYWMESRQLEIF